VIASTFLATDKVANDSAWRPFCGQKKEEEEEERNEGEVYA